MSKSGTSLDQDLDQSKGLITELRVEVYNVLRSLSSNETDTDEKDKVLSFSDISQRISALIARSAASARLIDTLVNVRGESIRPHATQALAHDGDAEELKSILSWRREGANLSKAALSIWDNEISKRFPIGSQVTSIKHAPHLGQVTQELERPERRGVVVSPSNLVSFLSNIEKKMHGALKISIRRDVHSGYPKELLILVRHVMVVHVHLVWKFETYRMSGEKSIDGQPTHGMVLHVASANIFGLDEIDNPPPLGGSKHAVFRRISEHAEIAVFTFRNSLDLLLLWLFKYERLFIDTCAVCMRHLMADGPGRTLLPPTLRPPGLEGSAAFHEGCYRYHRK